MFIAFSYTVAKEVWQKTDFDTTVKLQDRISREYDSFFSYFSLLGSIELTLGAALLLAILSFLRFKILAFLGWLMIIPATAFEVLGKILIFHPSTPVLFQRSVLEADLPSFYIHTNFSYPSGHVTRTAFFITVFLSLIIFSKKDPLFKLVALSLLLGLGFMMVLTRVYLGEHWLSDTIGGGFLGASFGLFASCLIVKGKGK